MTQSYRELLTTNFGLQSGGYTGSQGAIGFTGSVGIGGGPKIVDIQVTNSSYVVLDDTAVGLSGGFVRINGSGFESGCRVLINNTPATSVTFVSGTQVHAQLPANTAGTYIVYLVNADGGVAIAVNGITYSATPSWVTGSTLPTQQNNAAISIQLNASGASTYALAAGSTLPTGLSLSSGGLLSGTVSVTAETAYSFIINAIDTELQDSPRTFSLTVITLIPGQTAYTTPGTYSWTAPGGVTSVSVVCVGGGGSGGAAYYAGGGGGGGGLGWKNNISVTPGQSYTVVVGAGGVGVAANTGGQGTNGGESFFINNTVVRGAGGTAGVGTSSDAVTSALGGAGGSFVGDGGGTGGTGGVASGDTAGGGAGAGGYSGNGGSGGSDTSGSSGTGGGAGGGGAGGSNSTAGGAPSGGGVGILGQGSNGAGGTFFNRGNSNPGTGGSGGTSGSLNLTQGGTTGTGGLYGGGGGGQSNDGKSTPGCNGGGGAVRIIWGSGRSFPSTGTADQ
jgi:hypothetical protein